MKTELTYQRQRSWHDSLLAPVCCVLAALALMGSSALRAAEAVTTFATPEEATTALSNAVRTWDAHALRSLFGPDISEIQNPDRVQATNEFKAFAAALDEGLRLVRNSPTECELEIGTESWPFPIPIVLRDGRWFFDTDAGTEELLNRRIGKNELEVLEVMRGYVEAQREYAGKDRDGDQVLEYAQRVASSPGRKDGLYWPPELDGEISPMGPMVADAQPKGYFVSSPVGQAGPQPFHGYLFKILTRQGRQAPGGRYNYVINGNMIAGFALVAWPATYGDSGIMTFIVNQQGRVYQKDLGPNTARVAQNMRDYNPDDSWELSKD